jgi:hypothetical protein
MRTGYSYSTDPISGVDTLTLKAYFSSQCMEPWRDLDSYGRMVFDGNLGALKADFERRVQNVATNGNAHKIAVNQIYSMRYVNHS